MHTYHLVDRADTRVCLRMVDDIESFCGVLSCAIACSGNPCCTSAVHPLFICRCAGICISTATSSKPASPNTNNSELNDYDLQSRGALVAAESNHLILESRTNGVSGTSLAKVNNPQCKSESSRYIHGFGFAL
jgi:hypothetical protein